MRRLYEEDEFYDLKKDPCELHNEIHNPQYVNEICDLKERLLNHYMDTADVVPFEKDARFSKDFMLI